jgi:hypothetical protein
VYITRGSIRVGDWKLIVQNPGGRELVGTGGGWVYEVPTLHLNT